ncbi:hypothetical protein RJ641_033362 [Dillenia turbinata]|uniref:Protein LOW PSII ACCUMULATION 2, chloroplastic n=1 Tax=Dillenia turbinata TaxID=194707 RepID=A0AAN8ZG00_9MAGN
MALQINSPSSLTKPYLLSYPPLSLHRPIKHKRSFFIRSQNPSSDFNSTDEAELSAASSSPNSTGLGFGSSAKSKPVASESSSKKKQKGKRVIRRRVPVEKPAIFTPDGAAREKAEEVRRNESAFLLAWLGFGAVILVEGIALAASGFLPEEWDKFFVKYVYPSFTPTVFLFVAGTVFYGVFKYLQNEKLGSSK